MLNMETPSNEDELPWNLAPSEANKFKMVQENELGKASSSKLNQNGYAVTSAMSEFPLANPELLANNNLVINYVKLPVHNDSLLNKSIPPAEYLKKNTSAGLHLTVQRDNVLPVKKNTFMKVPKPDAFQLKAEAYNNHVKSSVTKSLGGKQIYFRFRVQESLHKIAHSKDDVVYQCHICKGPYKQKFSLKRHFLRNHINYEYISAADISNCKIHTPNGEIIQQFVEESKTPSGRKRFKTNGAIFFVPDGKTRVPGLYKCHQCPGIRFDLEDELEAHYSSHLNLNRDDIFPCNLCPSVFQRKQALSKHMVSHTEKKVIFHCKKCPQQFEKITDYTCHLQSHGSGKRCKYCDKEFSTPANRKRHENIHERGRVFSCKLCKVKFSRGKELEKHIKKMHSNLKLTCPHCPIQTNPVIFISQYLLETHITLKHRDIPAKKILASKTTGIYKTHSQKLSKESFCCFCKKKFSSVKAMVNHKNLVHKNEMALHKPKKFGQKEIAKEKSEEAPEGSRKFKNLPNSGKDPLEKNAALKAEEHSNKTGILGKKRTTYERKAKSSSHYKLSKDKLCRNNDKMYAKFYATIHSNIADNYINHVDGGINQLNLKNSSFQDQNEPFDYRVNTNEIPWSAQNFSNYFDPDSSMSKREEISVLFPQEQCLYATGLARNEVAFENSLHLKNENSSVVEVSVQSESQDKPLMSDLKENLLSREVCVTFVCDVCKGTFHSYSEFEDHSANNHPNVEVSFVELEGTNDNPPKVPGELKRPPYTQPNGILVSHELTFPAQEQCGIKCTKCDSKFDSKNELYAHIFKCVAETREAQIRRKLNQKNRKGLATKSRNDSAIKPIKSSGWFSWKKQLFKSGCFRRNKFQSRRHYLNNKGNKRGRRRLPLPTKLRANPCPFCESVFISAARLPEHIEICTKRYKKTTAEEKLKKKGHFKKRKNRRLPELSPSPVSFSENGSSSDSAKESNIPDKDIALPSCSNHHTLSTESGVSSIDPNLNLSSANHDSAELPTDNLKLPGAKVNDSSLNCEETEMLEKDNPVLFQNPEVDALRDLVRKVKEELSKDPLVEDLSEPCVKSKKIISVDLAGKNTIGLNSVNNSLTGNSKKNAAKSMKITKNENIIKPIITNAITEKNPKISEVSLPKIKEVVKEIKLAASSSPSLKKSNEPLIFLSPEADQNIELSSQNSNSTIGPLLTGVSFHPEKELSVAEDFKRVEKARQRKKRKPVKILHKMANEPENSVKISVPSFTNRPLGPCLSVPTLVNNSFKPIENPSDQMFSTSTGSEIPNLTIPENDKVDVHDLDKRCSTNVLESTTTDSSKNISTSIDNERLSPTDFLPENKPEGNEDRESPSLELLVSSVTQSIENFDKPSLLDDDKFSLQTPDLINPNTLKNTDMELTSENGLNFKIIIPTVDSPSKAQVSDKESSSYFASGIPADKTDGSSSPGPSSKNNVEGGYDILHSAVNKMKAILSNSAVGEKTKELINNKVKNSDSAPANNSYLMNDNFEPLTSDMKNKSVPISSTLKQLEFTTSESQQNHCLEKNKEKLVNKNGDFIEKLVTKEKQLDDKKTVKGSSNERDDSKSPAQEEFAIAATAVCLLAEQNSELLKDKVKSKIAEVVHGKSAVNESQKKKSLKPSLIKKSDSKNKGASSKPYAANNDQPKSASLDTNKQLTIKNKSNVQTFMSSSENSAKLRFLRMNKKTQGGAAGETANENIILDDLPETDNSDSHVLKKKRLNNSESVPANASNDDGCCSKTLENFHPADDDKNIVVKQENPDSDVIRHRNCPYCYLDFAYLSNFRRHLKTCSSKGRNFTKEAPVTPPSTQFQHLPKKNEVEDSILYLKRHQIRQNEFIKETKNSEDNKAKNSFQKFNCPICHKIYFSYFSFLQHQVQVHKMTNQAVSDGASTSQGDQMMPLDESGRENIMHQVTTAVNYDASTSQGVVMPLEETNSNSTLPTDDISSKLTDNEKESRTTVENCVKKSDQIENESNISSDIPVDELKSEDKEIKFGSLQNDVNHSEKVNNSDKSNNLTEKTIITHPSIKATSPSSDGRKGLKPIHDKGLTEPSQLTLPSFGKGRGRKKKSAPENLVLREEDPLTEHSNKAEGLSFSQPKIDNSILKALPVTNNSVGKDDEKTLISNLQSCPKNTLVNKLRNTLSKSMQCGIEVKTTLKPGKKSEMLKGDSDNDFKPLGKNTNSLKSPLKKNLGGTSKIAGKTSDQNISHPINISRRGRKKSIVSRVPVKQNIRGFKQESNNSLSQIDMQNKVNDATLEIRKTELNGRLQSPAKGNNFKPLENESPTGPTPNISDEKKISVKRSIANGFQSSKPAKVIKTTKSTLQEFNPDVQSSQKTSGSKAKNSRGIKPNCANNPIPSTSYGPSRSRNSKLISIPLDLSSELEDVEDVQQKKSFPKKKPNKVCPICKKKFPAMLQRNRHLQLVHGREKSRNEGAFPPTVFVNKEAVNKITDSLKKDTVNIVSDFLKKDTVNKLSDSLKKDTVNKVSDSLKKDTVNKVTDSLKKDAVNKVTDSFKKEAVNKVTGSPKKETVNKVIDSPKKETVNKATDTSKKGTINKVIDSFDFVPDRSSYQRQCSKPLPPMKRKYQKVGGKNIQSVKKGKI